MSAWKIAQLRTQIAALTELRERLLAEQQELITAAADNAERDAANFADTVASGYVQWPDFTAPRRPSRSDLGAKIRDARHTVADGHATPAGGA